ncbi:hypothetical protein D0T50_03330 [Bacteroides sp. 214]|uniref:DUF6263 family protein n=1 Tax=Bacteroides sp. 214 TaxID=2302935 RepID=UPI0013D42EB6|nr:DUF6263 family protein [Bacteroides sp. 214]NDW11921.1 hypothetical protein [Bacteroides sp. 214]
MKKALFTAICLFIGFSMATAQVTLTFNPDKGTKYDYRMEMIQNIKQNVMGQDMEVKQNMVTLYSMDIIEKSKESVKVKYEYKEVVFELSSMMMNMKYDSKNPAASTSPVDAAMATLMGSLIGKSFEAVITPAGKVLSVTGMDEIAAGMVAAAGDDAQLRAMAEQTKGQYSNEAIKGTLEQSFGIYPAGKVKVGDSWNVEQNIESAGMAIDIASVYKLISTDKNNTVMDVEATVDAMDGQLKGVQNGTISVESKTGIITKSELQQNIKGTVTAQGMDIAMDMNSKILVTTTKAK